MGRWIVFASIAVVGLAASTLLVGPQAWAQQKFLSHENSMMPLPDAGATSFNGVAFSVTNNADTANARAIRGGTTASNFQAVGVYGIATSNKEGARAMVGDAYGPIGVGVQGFNWATSRFGYGVYGGTMCPNGVGTAGFSFSASGLNLGVWGTSAGSSGRGVEGQVTSADTGAVKYGVLGTCIFGSNSYGVFARGDLGANGLKSFRIDHPQDPKNKYLVHYSSEGPVPQNVYNGIVTTDRNGYAWVRLPSYFGDINKDLRYSLTVIDRSADFVQAKVTVEIRDNAFQIRTSKPRIKVSWEVKGTRNDLYVRMKPPRDVVDKLANERGRYQQPELYGQPASQSSLGAGEAENMVKRPTPGER